MDTKYKYIHFDETAEGTWYCYNNKTGVTLGWATYYKKWKQWVMEFREVHVFNAQWLIDIADFLNKLNRRNNGTR